MFEKLKSSLHCFSNLPEAPQKYSLPISVVWPKKWITVFCAVILAIHLVLLFTFLKQSEPAMWLTSRSQKQRQFDYFQQWLDYDRDRQIQPEFDGFIHTQRMDGGVGNQLFRFASLYAIGQMLNRTPVYVHDEEKMHQMAEELARGFPKLHGRIYYLKSCLNSSDVVKADFEKDCCDYVDPEILLGHNDDKAHVMMLNGPGSLENFKYFHHIKQKIVEFLDFGQEIVENVTAIGEQTFKEDKQFKICVHTRNGDFVGLGQSRADQVGPAIDYILSHLPTFTGSEHTKFSLVLFGEDKPLLESLKFNNESLHKVYLVIDLKMGRIEELHLAQRTCQLFLDTAPLSSFAFWMGYLMPEYRPKFYIRKHIPSHKVDIFHQLPQEWFPIEEDWLK